MITEEQFAAAESEIAALIEMSSRPGLSRGVPNERYASTSAARITRAIKTAQAEAAAARRIGKIMARVQSEHREHGDYC